MTIAEAIIDRMEASAVRRGYAAMRPEIRAALSAAIGREATIEEAAEIVAGWVAEFYAEHLVDLPAVQARARNCVRTCRYFTVRCSLAGETCQSRGIWFGWLLAGDCGRYKPRENEATT